MKGYLIANYTIHDPATYQKYVAGAMPVLAQYEGKILIGDPNSKILEGQPNQFFIVVEFESTEAAQRFFDSPEYTKIKHLRISSTKGWVAIATQFEMPKH